MKEALKQESTENQPKPSRRKFLTGAAAATTGAAITGFPMISVAQSPIVIKMQGSWGSADIFNDMAQEYVKRVNEMTGGRLRRLRDWIGDETFMLTYGDGVADVDVNALLAWHREHGRLATVTAVRPPARFGGLDFNGNLVARFTEKPQIGEGWINGGFFVLEPAVLDYIADDETPFERDPLERLAAEDQLVAFRHDTFWQCMDTMRDVRLLNDLWAAEQAPWRMWQ